MLLLQSSFIILKMLFIQLLDSQLGCCILSVSIRLNLNQIIFSLHFESSVYVDGVD